MNIVFEDEDIPLIKDHKFYAKIKKKLGKKRNCLTADRVYTFMKIFDFNFRDVQFKKTTDGAWAQRKPRKHRKILQYGYAPSQFKKTHLYVGCKKSCDKCRNRIRCAL